MTLKNLKKGSAVKKPPARNTRRVEKTDTKTAPNKKVSPPIQASGSVVDGELIISAQMAETVPVAQYANVVIGPVGMTWKLGGIDMSVLADVDWEDDEDGFDLDKLSEEQLAVYSKARSALKASMKVIEHSIAEDREAVEESVRRHNERVESDKKEERKSSGSRRR